MQEENKDKLIFFLVGFFIGVGCTVFGGLLIYKVVKGGNGTARSVITSLVPSGSAKTPKRSEFYLSFENKADLQVFKPAEKTYFELAESHATHGKNSLMVKMESGSKYPGLQWEVYGRDVQNWTGAKDFHFDVYNNTEDYVRLTVKFKSGKKYPKKSFQYPVELDPLKMNHISIPIADIANMCDLTQMSYVKIFSQSPGNNIILFFDNMGTK